MGIIDRSSGFWIQGGLDGRSPDQTIKGFCRRVIVTHCLCVDPRRVLGLVYRGRVSHGKLPELYACPRLCRLEHAAFYRCAGDGSGHACGLPPEFVQEQIRKTTPMKPGVRSIFGFYRSGTLDELRRTGRMGESEYRKLVKVAVAYAKSHATGACHALTMFPRL